MLWERCLKTMYWLKGLIHDPLTFSIHSGSQKWHSIFPTNSSANLSNWSVENRNCRSISKSPYDSLQSCWHDLPVLSQIASLRIKKQNGTVKRITVTLYHTHNQIHLILPSHCCQAVNFRACNISTKQSETKNTKYISNFQSLQGKKQALYKSPFN